MNHHRDPSIRASAQPLLRHAGETATRQTPPVRTVDSASLFRGDHEIGIEHDGSLYRLKITRQGKLILNK